MRRLPLLASAVAACATAAALAVPAPAATPVRAVGEYVTFTASGLKPGRYTLTLVADDAPARGARCLARVGKPRRARDGEVRIRGRVPGRLRCIQGANVELGRIDTTPGRYHLVLGVKVAPAAWSTKHSFIRKPLRIR